MITTHHAEEENMADSIEKETASFNSVYVLIDEPGNVELFSGAKEIDTDKLGEHLQKFSGAISRALEKCKNLTGEFELKEVSLEAKTHS
jgi:hypothetical protein